MAVVIQVLVILLVFYAIYFVVNKSIPDSTVRMIIIAIAGVIAVILLLQTVGVIGDGRFLLLND